VKLNEVMTRDVDVIYPDASLQEAAERMKSLNVGSLPVCDGDRVLGMITDRDVTIRATAAGQAPGSTKVRDVMTPDVVYAFDDQDVKEAAKLMAEHQIRRLVVLNRDMRLTGIVSLGDVAVETGNDKLSGDVLEQVSQPAKPNR
jgi:CBS domain-containing protein